MKKAVASKFLLFYHVYIRLARTIYDTYDAQISSHDELISEFLFLLIFSTSIGKFITFFSKFIGTFLCTILPFTFMLVEFKLIRNEHVTAKFLTKFIAIKLQQNYTLRDLLNPIRKEMKVVSYG